MAWLVTSTFSRFFYKYEAPLKLEGIDRELNRAEVHDGLFVGTKSEVS